MHGVALKYFAEVAAAGSLSAASERLFVAVSAISRQIAKLEAEVGTPLFTRMSRGMVLSEAGELLLAHARRTLLESEAVLQDITSLKGAPSGTIRVVATDGPAHHFLPELMSAFRLRHPHARFSLHVCPQAEALRRVAQGQADLAVSFNSEQSQGTVARHSMSAPVYAVMCPAHPLARLARVLPRELAPYPLATGDPASSTRKLLERCWRLEGLRFEPIFVSNLSAALMSFVRNSDRVMLGPYLPAESALKRGGLVARPVNHPEMAFRRLQVHTMEGRLLPGMVEEFLGHIAASLQSMAHCGPAPGRQPRKGAKLKPRARPARAKGETPALA
ncbi:LysR family transcriptional regulator [Bordetella sp. H567]|uniref:LysR family transcriptional regulator n=1 Tax=Bordetella sp. H567 TaxID=1697043 RepID=UPI0008342D5F|nr:LysR substrate-binding domain-containing protein [Bordetella sp. H567]